MVDEQIVEQAALNDAMLRQSLPSAIPQGWEGKKFQPIGLPRDQMFTIRNFDTGQEFGPFVAEEFVTDPETNIVSGHDRDGSPVIIRALSAAGGQIVCIDDSGKQIMMVVNTSADNTLPVEEPSFGPLEPQ